MQQQASLEKLPVYHPKIEVGVKIDTHPHEGKKLKELKGIFGNFLHPDSKTFRTAELSNNPIWLSILQLLIYSKNSIY